ncbi:MAG: DUF4258 domain-containing protein [Pseudomonadota bacterium]
MEVVFLKRKFKFVMTEHVRQRMVLREISLNMIVDVIESGIVMKKSEENKYWVYKSISGRSDNAVSLSIAVEGPTLVVITALVNWRTYP